MDAATANAAEQATVDPRWVGLGFAIFALALVVYALALAAPWLALVALLAYTIASVALGLCSASRAGPRRQGALALLVVCVALALAAVAASGWLSSPFWPTLIPPLLAALLLLPGPAGRGVAAAIWLGYGVLALAAPPAQRAEVGAAWLLRGAEVALLALLLERTVEAQRALRQRTYAREVALHSFLAVANRLRASTSVQHALEEVANAVQSAGDFDCVTLSTVDWSRGQAQVVVAIGATGRRLGAVERLSYAYADLAQRLEAGTRTGAHAVEVKTLPFRGLSGELHLVLPLTTQLDEVRGVLTVSAARPRRAALREAVPLLELLANQADAALDNAELYATMAQRVEAATADLARSADELRGARDRAEVLYSNPTEVVNDASNPCRPPGG